MIRFTPAMLILFFLSVNIYKKKSEMHATTKRGHIQTSIRKVYFYPKWHVVLIIVHAQLVSTPLLHPLLTLLSELKPSKLKETEKSGEMFSFTPHAASLVWRHTVSQVHRAHTARHTSSLPTSPLETSLPSFASLTLLSFLI